MWRDWTEMPPWLEATRYQHGGWLPYKCPLRGIPSFEAKFLGPIWTCPTFRYWWSIQRLSLRGGLQIRCNICLKASFRNLSGAETTCFVGDMPAWFQFRWLHFYMQLIWSVRGLNLWISRGAHPTFGKKKVRILSMLFALVCCDSCCRFQWCLHFHFRTALAHRVPLLIWRAYIFIYAAMTQRVSFIYLALFVSKFVNRQAKVGKRSNQQVCL